MKKVITKKVKGLAKYGNDGGIVRTAMFLASVLRLHSKEVWGHCQRVAFLSEMTANELGKDKKAAFFGGLFHDLGKLFVRKELFDGHNITNKEYEEIREHALLGYFSLKDVHLFTALCCGLHHAVGENGYGLNSKNLPRKIKPNTLKKVFEISTIVSVCDFIDAFYTRKTKIKGDSNVKKSSLKNLLLKKFQEDKMVTGAALLQARKILKLN